MIKVVRGHPTPEELAA
ncbi:acyl-CoA carboxylase subunit epsilon, partial [Streptomyces sp. M2CJ-2]